MRPKKIDNEALMKGLTEVIKSKGYDGASLNDLAAASGLKKASLYHRFPGGKEEITRNVLMDIYGQLQENVFGVIADNTRTVKERLSIALQNLTEFYQDGEAVCIIRSLAFGKGLALFGDELRTTINDWIKAFEQLGIEIGLDKAAANDAAMESFIYLQGSLVLSNGLDSPIPFDKALSKIRYMYLR